ncbi:fungal-specific transcription factor domain-containing protein [Colletotrichum acutatum]|uniref:Fungal-specific transcription factor domain-containing protein n=1 Tax=Glomerella acutata TaxID=27357 RepID=A0AAD8UDN9_GLOAC|nr:fungal-specific transcription factor domain-containing protein [Colletotrichum acutatum]KAK1713332.1 fungal-specific transcription factor domain-containing protein [Colletotrichum acutatum]
MSKSNRRRVEHTRTFTGCRTCRSRHAKCDEGRPECAACRRNGINCAGYTARLTWIEDSDASGEANQRGPEVPEYRYTLFSDSEREIMSSQLTNSLGPKAAGKVLAEIDTVYKTSESEKAFSISKGPFGAFKSVKRREVPLTQLSPSPTLSEHDTSLLLDPEHASMPDLQSDFSVDILPMSWPEHVEDTTCGEDGDIIVPVTNAVETDNKLATPHADAATVVTIPPASSCLGASTSLSKVPEQAQALLRYYTSHVGSTKTSGQGKFKSAWQLLFLLCAFETFAEFRLTILCALFAHSAFQLHKTDLTPRSPDYWQHLGNKHQERARMHLKNAVKIDIHDSGLGGYKDLLMALIAMAMGSCHESRDSRVFLLDAERLIRVKGLASHNSEIVRVLHHTYTYIRVIAEATYPFWDSESESDRTSLLEFEAIASNSFHIREESLNTGLDPNEEKSKTVGYADIHLESQGLWRETLHSNIHGIPESLMTLLAQTIQLSNEKDHLETRARSNPKLASDFKTHSIDNEGNLITQPSTQSMVQAMHRALIIYFHRQIHDVSAMLLQYVIHQALGHLESCLDSMVRGDDFALGIMWTVYICARKSISPELQERALKCISITDARGLHLTSKPSAEAVSLL